jgi:hypothetical protein
VDTPFTRLIHFSNDKKGSSYRRLAWRRSVISSSSTYGLRCSVLITVYLLLHRLKIPNFTNVELTDMVLANGEGCGGWQRDRSANTVPGIPGTVSRQSCPWEGNFWIFVESTFES